MTTLPEATYFSSAYLAPVEYYVHLYACKKGYIECHDHYLKQTYRNRCHIAAANGIQTLSIPVQKTEDEKCVMKDIRISDHGNWRHLHWTAISSAYNNSPFFEYYEDDLHPFYEKRWEFLFDFNEELRRAICKLIDFQPSYSITKSYLSDFLPTELNLRESIHPKYTQNNLSVTPYYQVFESRHGFIPNLSIIDLLFNMGPESLLVLKDSASSLQAVQSLSLEK